MVFLDGVEEGKVVIFKRPGALHKARWMAKHIPSKSVFLINTSPFCHQAQSPQKGKL